MVINLKRISTQNGMCIRRRYEKGNEAHENGHLPGRQVIRYREFTESLGSKPPYLNAVGVRKNSKI